MHKVDLLIAFLRMADWQHAAPLLRRYSPWIAFFPRLTETVRAVLHICLEPHFKLLRKTERFPSLYKPGAPALEQYRSLLMKPDQWEKQAIASGFLEPGGLLASLLELTGTCLCVDGPLLSKLISVGQQHLADTRKASLPMWMRILRCSILPSLAMGSPNPALLMDVHSLICMAPYPERYKVYAYWRSETYTLSAELRVMKAIIREEIRLFVKYV